MSRLGDVRRQAEAVVARRTIESQLVWVFGSPRSGSTWLRSMMGELESSGVWEEPMVGRLFGEFYARTPKDNLRSADFGAVLVEAGFELAVSRAKYRDDEVAQRDGVYPETYLLYRAGS